MSSTERFFALAERAPEPAQCGDVATSRRPGFDLGGGNVMVVNTPEDPRDLEPWLADESVQSFDAKARPLTTVSIRRVKRSHR